MKNQTKPKITRKQQCVIYTRVSTDLQAEVEFNSCEAQELKIKSYIDSQDKCIYKASYSDKGFSGGNLNRPNLQQLLQDVKLKKFNTILVYKLDRLTRSLKDFYNLIEYLDSYNVSFISITESFDTSTPAGRLFLNMMLTFAQYEREIAGERVKDKLLERAKKGMWKGGHTPFGYNKVDKKIFPDKEEAKIVNKMFEIFIETRSCASVYHALKEDKIKNRQGILFTRKAIHDILKNIIYTGKIKFNNIIYDGIHDAIISEHFFNLAQDVHQKRVVKHKIYHNHLLGGLVECKECSYSMTPVFTNKKQNINNGNKKLKRYFYYRCLSTIKKDWGSCKVKQIGANKLENFIIENLERVLKDELYLENFVFRLNNDPNLRKNSIHTTHQKGYELSNPEISYTVEKVKSVFFGALNTLLDSPKQETAILLKNYIQKIYYSNETIILKCQYPSQETSPQITEKLPLNHNLGTYRGNSPNTDDNSTKKLKNLIQENLENFTPIDIDILNDTKLDNEKKNIVKNKAVGMVRYETFNGMMMYHLTIL